MPTPLLSLITPLADAGRSRKTGAKAANLSRLIAERFAVPRGFVLSSDAYRAHVWAGGARELATTHAEAEDREQVRTSILSQPIPDDISGAVLKAYEQLSLQIGDRDPKVAVRPSAEEPGGADFPGAYESFINVSGEDALLSAIKRVWASLWSGKAAAFRARASLTGEPVMAVIVQQMVTPSVSGTVSTANPVTGDPRKLMVSFTADQSEPARVELDLACSIEAGCSIPAEVTLAAEKSVLAEEVCDGPCEVEWAFEGDKFWVLQLRPLNEQAGAFPVPDGLDQGSNWRLLSRVSVSPFSRSIIGRKPESTLMPPRQWGGDRMSANGYVYARVPDGAVDIADGVSALNRCRQAGSAVTTRCRSLSSTDLAQADWPKLLRALMEAVDDAVVSQHWLDAARYAAPRSCAAARETIQDDALFFRLVDGIESPIVLRDARLHELAERFALAEEAGRVTNAEWWGDYKADVLKLARDYGFALPDEAATCDCAQWRSWVEDTDTVFQLISALSRIGHGPSLVTRYCGAQQDSADAESALSPAMRKKLKTVLGLARGWLTAREETELACALALSTLRGVLLDIGGRMRVSGMIADVGDAFQLTLDELLSTTTEPTPDDRAACARLVAGRKHELWLDSRLIPSSTLPRRDDVDDPCEAGGVGVSPGTAAGVARYVQNGSDAADFAPGDILVAGGCGTAWTSLLAIAGGLVLTDSDELSTAARLARLYEIPAAAGFPKAGAIGGKLVTVNGSDGTVEPGRRTASAHASPLETQ